MTKTMPDWWGKTKQISPEVRIGITCFFILLFSYAYFIQIHSNPNAVSRMGLALSLVEDGTVTINRWHKHTGDKAMYNGNYYSDKAPGLSFAALPIVLVGKMLLRIDDNSRGRIFTGVDRKFKLIVYISTVFTSGLFTAITALLLYFVSLRSGASISGAVFAMLGFGLASPAWGWATAFFSHAMAGSCLFMAFGIIIYLDQNSQDNRRDTLLGFLAGALLSWAVVVEYPSAIASAVIIIFGISKALKWGNKKAGRVTISAIFGGIIFIVPLLYYHYVAFGSPFVVGYIHANLSDYPAIQEGFLGFKYPRPWVLFKILFSPYRGMLWFSPILILSPIGIFYLWRQPHNRGIALTITLTSFYYLLMNSAFPYWEGGWSTGPRYTVPMVPFVCLPFSIMWTRVHSKWKPVLLGLFGLSLGISLICVSVSMMSPYQFQNPLFDFLIPRFLDGNLNSIFNRIGISSHVSLMPLFIIWIIGGIYVRKLLINHNQEGKPDQGNWGSRESMSESW